MPEVTQGDGHRPTQSSPRPRKILLTRFLHGVVFQCGRIAVDRMRGVNWDTVSDEIEKIWDWLPF